MKKTIKIVELNVNQRGRLSRYLNEKLLDYVDFRTDVLILLEYNSLSVNAQSPVPPLTRTFDIMI